MTIPIGIACFDTYGITVSNGNDVRVALNE